MTLGQHPDQAIEIDLTLYSSSISWLAVCSGERLALVGSAGPNRVSRSFAVL